MFFHQMVWQCILAIIFSATTCYFVTKFMLYHSVKNLKPLLLTEAQRTIARHRQKQLRPARSCNCDQDCDHRLNSSSNTNAHHNENKGSDLLPPTNMTCDTASPLDFNCIPSGRSLAGIVGVEYEPITDSSIDDKPNSINASSEDSGRQGSLTPTTLTNTQDSDTESVIDENKRRSKNIKNKRNSNKSINSNFFLGDDSSSAASCDSNEDLDSSDFENLSNTSNQEQGSVSIKGRRGHKIRPPDLSDESIDSTQDQATDSERQIRSQDELLSLMKEENGLNIMTDDELISLVDARHIPAYQLEKLLSDPERGVKIRRMILSRDSGCKSIITDLPYVKYNYSLVMGACCENVIGYMPVPLGVVGPLLVDDKRYHIPMATTEGCLVASTNRGCRAIMQSGGVRSELVADGMTRAPCVKFSSTMRAAAAMKWIQQVENFALIKNIFDSTSRFARLEKIHSRIAGPYLYIRFAAKSGDAMGMNMVSKGAELVLCQLKEVFPDMEMSILSGNFCSDKKPSAVNWIEGRGKSVVCEARIPEKVVKKVLKTSVKALVESNVCKNLVGSAVAGSIGGFNSHAANVVAAVYIATGQDPAQTVGSSNCITLMESKRDEDGTENLCISCSMPSLELGTIGGGTILPAQASCLDLIGVKGSCVEEPAKNAQQFARVVCAAVLAAELSLLSALTEGVLVKSHMKHNRSTVSMNATPVTPSSGRTSQSFVIHCQPQ
ncbi:3-hydroxy-3-methylglutaryl-coenzyme A reductase 2-like [Brevipalpus obovatus]|uniref:3-hydroxy-3-methylglutaryl-coenzyme A reductase 2-like n=1 Tax=Brevipalpus obovatus TaxID=246614 RepID=UPI003D9E9723